MGAREQTWARRAEQFPHLGNYTLTPGYIIQIVEDRVLVTTNKVSSLGLHLAHVQ